MDNFDAHKWFKKEYLGEGHTEDKVVAKGEGIEITQDQMKRLHNGEVVRLSNGSTLSFVKEGMSDKEFKDAQEADALEKHPEKDTIKAIQAMLAKEREIQANKMGTKDLSKSSSLIGRMGDRSLREDDLDEIAFGDAGTDKRTGQVVGEIIELIRSTGVDAYEVMEELGQEFGINFEFGRG